MNTKKILNKLILWKDINNFYSFDQLVLLSNKYYEGVRIVLAADDCILDFNFYGTRIINPFTNKNEIVLEVHYNGLLFCKTKNNIDQNNINHNYNPWFKTSCYIFYKKNFKQEFKSKILDSIKADHLIKKFCLLGELYYYILDGINI